MTRVNPVLVRVLGCDARDASCERPAVRETHGGKGSMAAYLPDGQEERAAA